MAKETIYTFSDQ